MRKFFFLAVILCLMVSAASAEALKWRTGSVDAALAAAKAEGKLLLIDFFTETG